MAPDPKQQGRTMIYSSDNNRRRCNMPGNICRDTTKGLAGGEAQVEIRDRRVGIYDITGPPSTLPQADRQAGSEAH